MCGIAGVYDAGGEAGFKIIPLLAKMQNRGPQGAGVVSCDASGAFHEVRGSGSVEAVFNSPEKVRQLPGRFAVGQVRYATFGETIQPLVWNQQGIMAALTHNGEFANAITLRARAEEQWGYKFQSTSDTEVLIPYLMYAAGETFEEKLLEVLQSAIRGAFSFVILYDGKFYCVRDQYGFRPLAFGMEERLNIVVSESSAIEVLGGRYITDIEAGQLMVIGPSGIEKTIQWAPPTRKSCIFEHVYFANPDSYVERINVSVARDRMGKILFEESGWVDADVFIPILDSGLHPGLGLYEAMLEYAREHGKKPPRLKAGVHRSWFLGRTFQQEDEVSREVLQRVKSSVIKPWVEDQRVILMDDSIVRGIVTRIVIQLMRLAGAREVHVRIASPPPLYPCGYGIDTYKDELIAARLNGDLEEVRRFLGADSLCYLSLEGLYRAVVGAKSPSVRGEEDFCVACFTGCYPIPFEQNRLTKPKKRGTSIFVPLTDLS